MAEQSTRRQQQIERFPPIETPSEKLAAMRGDMMQLAEDAARRDDRTEAVRFFHGVINVLAFVAVIGALVGLYLVTP